MKTLKITFALAFLFIVITSFTLKEDKFNTVIHQSTPKQVFYINGLAQD